MAADCSKQVALGRTPPGRLADLQRPLELRPGAIQVPRIPQHAAEVMAV
jgi:hypothetical protein